MRKAKEIQTGEFRQDVNAAKEKIEQCARRISEIPESVERELVEGSHVDGQATIDAAATIKQHCGDAMEDMLLVPKEGLQGRVHGASVGAMERVLAYQYVPKTRTYLLWVEDSDEHGAAILPRRLVLPNERELNMSEKRIGMGGVKASSLGPDDDDEDVALEPGEWRILFRVPVCRCGYIVDEEEQRQKIEAFMNQGSDSERAANSDLQGAIQVAEASFAQMRNDGIIGVKDAQYEQLIEMFSNHAVFKKQLATAIANDVKISLVSLGQRARTQWHG